MALGLINAGEAEAATPAGLRAGCLGYGSDYDGSDLAGTLSFDNDRVAGTDSSYTTGVRLALAETAYAPDGARRNRWLGGAPDLVRGLQNALLPPNLRITPQGTRQSFGGGFSVFTPADTVTETPPADDRPYASSAYVFYGLEQDFCDPDPGGQQNFFISSRYFTNVEFQAGLIGREPGESILEAFHRIYPPGGNANGWDARHVNYEPTLNVFYNRVWSGFPLPRLFGADRVRDWEGSQAFSSQRTASSPSSSAPTPASPWATCTPMATPG